MRSLVCRRCEGCGLASTAGPSGGDCPRCAAYLFIFQIISGTDCEDLSSDLSQDFISTHLHFNFIMTNVKYIYFYNIC